MAGYRPKSLEELNSLYDKSLNVKNEIDKKASDLEIRQEIYTPVAPVVPEVQDVQQETSEAPAQEITGLVDDFIKNFSAEPVKRVRPVAPTTLKTVSSAKKEEARSPVMQGAPVQGVPSATHDKPRLIRNSERNDLFENYKKVMDDEDDEEYSRHRLGRKRSKKLFEKKAAAVQEEVQTPENEAAPEPYDTDGQAVIEPDENEIPETLENIDAVIAIEKPKFLPHRQNVINSIANILDVNPNQIFVKAKTGEKIGDVGEGKVVEVWATCLLSKTN